MDGAPGSGIRIEKKEESRANLKGLERILFALAALGMRRVEALRPVRSEADEEIVGGSSGNTANQNGKRVNAP